MVVVQATVGLKPFHKHFTWCVDHRRQQKERKKVFRCEVAHNVHCGEMWYTVVYRGEMWYAVVSFVSNMCLNI